jgi:hypothetical protein
LSLDLKFKVKGVQPPEPSLPAPPAGRYLLAGLDVMAPSSGAPVDRLFRGPTLSPTPGNVVVLKIRSDAWKKVPYSHLPHVVFEDTAGRQTKCHGVDPIIINNAD